MPILLNVAAIVALVAGLVASQVVKSDIRIEVVATCWIGGFLLAGLAGILGRIEKIEARLARAPWERAVPPDTNDSRNHDDPGEAS